MRYNYSKDSEYHSQRNNMSVPYASCNTTSMIMALKQAGWELPDTGDKQPEDALSEFLQTPEAYEIQKELAPWSIGAYPPQEVHMCLQWGTNKWIGESADVFIEGAEAAELIVALDSGCGIVLSGRFPMRGGDMGHIVSLAGYTKSDRTSELTSWIIDDPYGNWHLGYQDSHGNNVELTPKQFSTIFDRGGHYWVHWVKKSWV